MLLGRFHWGIFWLLTLAAVPAAALVPTPDILREEALRHANGEDDPDRDYGRAYDLFCLAALEGDGRSAYHLGLMYLDGLGRTVDEARAAGWLSQAAKLGEPGAAGIIEARLPAVAAADDPNCPLVKAQPERVHIKTWVHLLAPYYKIHPDLVLSIIQVESNFDARAKSPKDAYGLMQLILPTAKRFEVKDVWDPLQNIKGGMAYLAWLKDHFRYARGRKPGRIRLMVAAYNAGEHAVKKHGGIPPYDETRKYVKRVVGIYARYIKARRGLTASAGSVAGSKQARVRSAALQRKWNARLSAGYTPLSSAK